MRLIYGCTENTAPPARANAFTGAWKRDVLALGVAVPVEIAARVPGAMLLRRGATAGHIAVSVGTGRPSRPAAAPTAWSARRSRDGPGTTAC